MAMLDFHTCGILKSSLTAEMELGTVPSSGFTVVGKIVFPSALVIVVSLL